MKLKILETLKTRYKNLGFGDKAFDGVAEYLSKLITKDEEVEATVAGAESLLKAFQGDADKRVTDAIAKEKTKWQSENKPEQHKPEESTKTDPATKTNSDEPEWAKSLQTTLKTVTEELTAIKQDKVMQGQHLKIKAKLEEAKVPEVYYGKMMAGKVFKDEAEIEGFTNELVTGWEQVRQSLADQNLGQTHKPLLGDKQKDGVSSAVQEYINAKTKTDAKDSLGGKKLTQE